MRDFRFSCNVFAIRSREQFARYCRDAERYGYASVFTADHLGSPSPFPPLVLAAEDRMLSLAARRADTVALAGLVQAPGRPPGTFHLQAAAQTDDRVRFVRAQAGDRADDLELNVLVQAVVVTPDRHAAAARLIADFGMNLSADEVLETPFVLIGSVAEIAAQLHERRQRFGISHITVHEPYTTAFAPVIERQG